MARIDLPNGRNRFSIEIPEDYSTDVLIPPRTSTGADPIAIISSALSHPIGTPCLEQMVQPENRVAIIVDDITRETPTAIVLPLILEALARIGVPREKIGIVIALGTHRPMTPAELDRKIGPSIARDYRIVNVQACNCDEMVYMGISSRGIPAWINRAVAEANFRIGMVSSGLSVETIRRMGFDHYFTVEMAIDQGIGSKDIAVLTHGGVIFLLLPDGSAESA